jgi:hypothetical protein
MKKTFEEKEIEHDIQVEIAMRIIEEVIEPLHYPKKGVSGEKYYQLEDSIINIVKKYI